MKPNITTTKRIGKSAAEIKAALDKLHRTQVLVGIPNDHATRDADPAVNNAELAYLHSNGSALQGIPARPFIQPAISAPDNKALITRELGEAATAVLDERPGEAQTHLEKAGQLGENAAKRWFTDPRNGWAPNAETTIRRKGSDRPLIDTGQLRRAITHVVVDEENGNTGVTN